MYKLYCRLFQGALKLSNYFLGYRMPVYVEGCGSIARLPALLRENGVDRILLVTGPHITQQGLTRPLLEGLDAQKLRYTVFSGVRPNPTSDMVEAGVRLYRAQRCRAIVAFGGGSPMDCAKAIAARVARPGKTVAQLQGLLKVMKKIPPLYAVPTTSGTGSETTIAAVITDTATRRKAAINDIALIPTHAVLDPALCVSMTPFVTATTGMDALCHAVEAYTNHRYNTPLEDRLACQAVRLIYDNLLPAYRDGSDLTARANMQKAAFFAGRAFTRGCVGYVHAVGHTLGSLYDVPHGLAMAVILPKVMRQFGAAVYHRLAILAGVCGITGADEREKAERFLDWIEETNREMGLPDGFTVIREEDIPQMVAWALREANPLYPVPVIWREAQLRRLIESLRRGA